MCMFQLALMFICLTASEDSNTTQAFSRTGLGMNILTLWNVLESPFGRTSSHPPHTKVLSLIWPAVSKEEKWKVKLFPKPAPSPTQPAYIFPGALGQKTCDLGWSPRTSNLPGAQRNGNSCKRFFPSVYAKYLVQVVQKAGMLPYSVSPTPNRAPTPFSDAWQA